MPFFDDPLYEDVNGPAGWIRQQAGKRGLHVEVDRDLLYPGYASRDGTTIIARPGLSVPSFHWLVASSVLASLFGFDAAPDLPIDPPDAKVIPFQRGPAFTFWDNRRLR